MKSVQHILTVGILAAFAAVTSGCGPKESQASGGEAGPEAPAEQAAGVTFSEKHGLRVPEFTAKFIGLETVEVSERSVRPTFRFEAQIFRSTSEAQFASLKAMASPTALATAVLGTNDAAGLKRGQEVSVEGQNGERFTGRVSDTSALLPGSAQSETIVAVDDPKGSLKRGQTVNVLVANGKERMALTVPSSALLKAAEGTFVYTMSGDHYVRAAVTTGVRTEEFAEITEGLVSGDQIVLRPVMTLWLAELQAIRGGKACADGH